MTDRYDEDGDVIDFRTRQRVPPADDAPPPSDADAPPEQQGGRQTQADALLELAGCLELVCDDDGDTYAVVADDPRRPVHAMRSRGLRRWLIHRYYATHERAPNEEAQRTAIATLEARAQAEGIRRTVHVRVAPHYDGSVYLDLGSDQWDAVRVASDGWQIERRPPVVFRRSSSTHPLPYPERGGDVAELRGLLNVRSDNDWRLLLAWLTAALTPMGPYPVLLLTGEQGSAKSTASRLIRGLIDPCAAPLRAEPKEVRDLMIAARSSWVVALDNVTNVQPWLSDAICRLATGGGFSTRELYSDMDEILFDARRPVLLNGIGAIASRGDLLDRALRVELEPIPPEQRRREGEIIDAYEHARPRILGALLDRVAGALRELPRTELETLPRMADFACLAVAAERAAGESGFLNAYDSSRADAYQSTIEAEPIGGPLLTLMAEHNTWEGTCSELLDALEPLAGDRATKARDWPRGGRAVASRVDRIAPALRASGIEIERHRRNRARVIRIVRHATDDEQTELEL